MARIRTHNRRRARAQLRAVQQQVKARRWPRLIRNLRRGLRALGRALIQVSIAFHQAAEQHGRLRTLVLEVRR